MFIEYEGYIINIVYLNLPSGSHGNSVPNEDGSFTMFLDPRDTLEMQEYGFQHEFEDHIKSKHFDNIEDKNADKLEAEAHHITETKPESVETPMPEWAMKYLEKYRRLHKKEMRSLKRRQKRQEKYDHYLEMFGCDIDEVREIRLENQRLGLYDL